MSAPKSLRGPIVMVGWPPASIIDPSSTSPRGGDDGIKDTNSLTILRISLLLLVPALGGLAVFWSAALRGSP